METIYQGQIATNGSTTIVCTTGRLVVNTIIINNLANDYHIILYKHIGIPEAQVVPIYRFDLDAGDSIRDTESYTLFPGNYLQITTNVIGGTYYVSATQS
jgi:hypothetical protein